MGANFTAILLCTVDWKKNRKQRLPTENIINMMKEYKKLWLKNKMIKQFIQNPIMELYSDLKYNKIFL